MVGPGTSDTISRSHFVGQFCIRMKNSASAQAKCYFSESFCHYGRGMAKQPQQQQQRVVYW